ncbi:MAG: DUF1304 domain-containing protein [Pseudobdellovibrio sp.]
MIIKNIFIALVALLHIYFLILEMFLWTKPIGLKAFAMTAEQAEATSVLAGNQGLYNGFLAAGLIWSLFHPDPVFSKQIAIFFLGCVICAALYGWYSVNIKILFIQGTPALVALALTLLL